MLPFRSLATHVRAAALLTLALGAPLVPASAQSPRATNGTAAPAQSNGPALVLVVRHAEKADNSDDPVLSAAGSR
ncbi:MAG: hypothetical protein MUD17_02695 [Gemmatimonadaceae bacterium]|nr:hypothetical protein [Gemmatimonadaceae bacterium]